MSHLHLPWRMVNASFIRIPFNEFGVKFARRQGEYIKALLDNNATPESSWYIDQSAFYMVHAFLREEKAEGFEDIGKGTSKFFRFPNHATGDKNTFLHEMRKIRQAAESKEQVSGSFDPRTVRGRR